MKFLFTLDDLLAMRTNGWSCPECGTAWLDLDSPSMAVPVVAGYDDNCRHPKLVRTMISNPSSIPA